MTEIEIKLKEGFTDRSTIARIDRAITHAGLTITMRGTVKSYPGCTHWHCKLGKCTGTLEITFWPAQKRAWFKIQKARAAEWIEQIIPRLKRLIEQ